MTSPRFLVLSIGLVLASSGVLDARIVRTWTDQELLDKSDLVIIAIPTATRDTLERGPLPGDERQPAIGVQTDFSVISVLKGLPTIKTVTLHHYRPDGTAVPDRFTYYGQVVNGPTFVSFDLKGVRAYRLCLVRQADGLYAPVAGQQDPDLSIREESAK